MGGGGGHHKEATLAAAGVLTTLLIGLSLSVEFSTEFLEEFLEEKHLLPMLYHVYKEIMILGLCSLVMFFEENYHFMDKLIPGGQFDHHLFHYIHMTLFFTVMIYVTLISILLALAMLFSNGLKKYETRSTAEAKREFKDLDERVTKMGFFSFLNPILKRRHNQVFFEIEYQAVREHFIEQHDLPKDYAFYVYIRKCTREKVLHMGGVHWSVWVMILFFVFLNTVRTSIITYDSGGGAVEFLVMLYFVFFFATAVYMKMRKILKSLLEKEFQGSQKRSKSKSSSGGGHGASGHGSTPRKSLLDHEGSDDEHAAAQHALLHGDDDDSFAKEHKKLFWFGKPGFISRSVQFITLMLALLMPIYFTYFATRWHTVVGEGEEFTLTVATVLPVIIILFVYLPWILPNFVFCTSIGEMFNEEAMREAVFKTPSYIAEHGVHKHKHHHDHAAVIKAEHHGGHGHGHGGGGHGHGGGGHDAHGAHDAHGDHGDHGGHGSSGHGGGHDDHDGHDGHKSSSRGLSSASKRSKSQEHRDDHH